MAIKRKLAIEVNLREGGTLSFEGDQAQSVLQQFERRQYGQTPNNELIYFDDNGDRQTMEWHCICGYKMLPTTEEVVADPVFDPMDCIEPVVRPENPFNLVVTPTSDGAKITADQVAGAKLVIIQGLDELFEGEIDSNEVSITGLVSATAVEKGEYKIIWRGPVRDSYKVDVPAFTVL